MIKQWLWVFRKCYNKKVSIVKLLLISKMINKYKFIIKKLKDEKSAEKSIKDDLK